MDDRTSINSIAVRRRLDDQDALIAAATPFIRAQAFADVIAMIRNGYGVAH